MKKYLYFLLMILLTVPGCEKLGKDGRAKKQIDWSAWYNDGETDNRPSVKIMSFNLRNNRMGGDTGEKNWKVRRAGCVSMINTHRPVLMGVQEAYRDMADYLKENCPGYDYVGISRNGNGTNNEIPAIFYLKDSISVESWGTFWLSDTPDKPSKPSGGDYNRSVTWMRAKHKSSGNVFYHFNTHLNTNKGIHGLELEVLMNQAQSICGDSPVAFTADWNEGEDAAVFEFFLEAYLSARENGLIRDKKPTVNEFTGLPKARVAHVFYNGFPLCARFETLDQPWEGIRYISDHYPVYAILKFE